MSGANLVAFCQADLRQNCIQHLRCSFAYSYYHIDRQPNRRPRSGLIGHNHRQRIGRCLLRVEGRSRFDKYVSRTVAKFKHIQSFAFQTIRQVANSAVRNHRSHQTTSTAVLQNKQRRARSVHKCRCLQSSCNTLHFRPVTLIFVVDCTDLDHVPCPRIQAGQLMRLHVVCSNNVHREPDVRLGSMTKFISRDRRPDVHRLRPPHRQAHRRRVRCHYVDRFARRFNYIRYTYRQRKHSTASPAVIRCQRQRIRRSQFLKIQCSSQTNAAIFINKQPLRSDARQLIDQRIPIRINRFHSGKNNRPCRTAFRYHSLTILRKLRHIIDVPYQNGQAYRHADLIQICCSHRQHIGRCRLKIE